jgi:hypothetical protein
MSESNHKYLFDVIVKFSAFDIVGIRHRKFLADDKSILLDESLLLDKVNEEYNCKVVSERGSYEKKVSKTDAFIDLVEFVKELDSTNIQYLKVSDDSKNLIFGKDDSADKRNKTLFYLKDRLASVSRRYSFLENEVSYALYSGQPEESGHKSDVSTLFSIMETGGEKSFYDIEIKISNGKLGDFRIVAETNSEEKSAYFTSQAIGNHVYNVISVYNAFDKINQFVEKSDGLQAYNNIVKLLSTLSLDRVSNIDVTKDEAINISLFAPVKDEQMHYLKNEIANIAGSYGYDVQSIKEILMNGKGQVPMPNIMMSAAAATKITLGQQIS